MARQKEKRYPAAAEERFVQIWYNQGIGSAHKVPPQMGPPSSASWSSYSVLRGFMDWPLAGPVMVLLTLLMVIIRINLIAGHRPTNHGHVPTLSFLWVSGCDKESWGIVFFLMLSWVVEEAKDRPTWLTECLREWQNYLLMKLKSQNWLNGIAKF